MGSHNASSRRVITVTAISINKVFELVELMTHCCLREGGVRKGAGVHEGQDSCDKAGIIVWERDR